MQTYEKWRGRRWKFGPLPWPEIDHEHCLECSTAIGKDEQGNAEQGYFFAEDTTALYNDADISFVPEKLRETFWHELCCLCPACYHRLAPAFDWSCVQPQEGLPIYSAEG
jgi:hypothetical protein